MAKPELQREGALRHEGRGPRASRPMGTDLRRAVELRRGIPFQSRLLELLDFSGLESRHLLNQLLYGLGGGLTNLYELHGRRIVRLIGRQNPPLVAISSIPSGHIGDGTRC